MKIILSVLVAGCCLTAVDPSRAQTIADPRRPPPATAPQAVAGYATSKDAIPYSANVMTGYGPARTGYSATAMTGYAGASRIASTPAPDDVVGRPADADPLQSPDSAKAVKPPPPVMVTDAQGATWVFDPTLEGWRNRSTSAVRFGEPRRAQSLTDAGQPNWVKQPDSPN
jgi:hypothetical protein